MQELEKNVTANNDFKNFINKNLAAERAHKIDEAEILCEKKLECLKRKTNTLKTKLKISKW